MRLREIMEHASTGATSAANMAPVMDSLGTTSRSGGGLLSGKYTNDPTPNTPREYKRNKNARRRFENSPSY
jgi:hypothetical protein